MAKTKNAEEKKSPKPRHRLPRREHRSGSFCGYDTDGISYWPAPTYTLPMQDILDKRAALQDFIDATSRHLEQSYTVLRKRQSDVWNRMLSDIGLDPSLKWTYHTGRLWIPKEEADEKRKSANAGGRMTDRNSAPPQEPKKGTTT